MLVVEGLKGSSGEVEMMFVIESASEAGDYLREALTAAGTYKVSIDVRENGVAVKVNESMWTATMSTKYNYGEGS